MGRLGDRELNWKAYGDEYEVVVFDEGRYAVYNFNINGFFGRRTPWYATRDEAIGSMQQLKLITNQ